MDIITSHQNADFDSLASMVAASKLYPGAKLVFSGSMEENLRYYLSQQQSKQYFAPQLNIKHYKAKEIDFARVRRLILVDTRGERLGSLSPLLKKAKLSIHIYDHHPGQPSDLKGEMEVIRQVGATTTILVEILREQKIPLTPQEATLFALGIYEDTGFLTFKTTSEADLQAVSYLLHSGADLSLIPDFIKRELSGEQVALLNELVQTAQVFEVHNVQVMIATASCDKYIGDIAVLAHKLRDMENADVLFVLARVEGRITIVARSRIQEVNVGELLRPLGGGGHTTAASASVRNLTLIQTQEKLLQLLEEHIPPLKLAAQIMTVPVKSVTPSASLSAAKELLIRHSINNLPVINRQEKLLGIINRQTIDKALAHGLKGSPVSEVMLSKVQTVSPRDDLDTIKHRMMERHQQFLPVVDKNKLVGIITRTDLLRILHEKPLPFSPGKNKRKSPHKQNLKGLLRERLPQTIQDILHLAGEAGDELGFGVYVVGGVVRDMLLRMENLDVDVVVEKDGIQFARHLSKRVGGRFRSYEKFGTAMVIFPNGFKLDVATARTEYYRHPAALPIVEQSSIKQDLYRRDFTINALAIKLNQAEFGSLIDFFGGQQDLKNGVIRVLHSLSLVEDPTRVFRAIRFEQRFGFRIGKHTLNLIKNAARKNLCAFLDGKRLFSELCLIFQEENPHRSIQRMSELDLLKFIHPQLQLDQQKLQSLSQLKTVLDWYGLLFLKQKAQAWLLYLLGLASYLSLEQVQELILRLELNERQSTAILTACRQLPGLQKQIQNKTAYPPSQIYALLKPASLETLLLAMAKSDSPLVKQRISMYLTKLQHEQPLISGKELKELGFSPGPIFSRIKQDLLNARLDGKVKTRQDELAWVKKKFKTRG